MRRWLARLCLGVAVLSSGTWIALQADAWWFQMRGETRLDELIAEGPSRELPMEPGSLVGRIEIPRVGVSAIIVLGVDEQSLRRAVGLVPGSVPPGYLGNSVLAGHRDTHFRGLRDLTTGDSIQITTPHGVHWYQVDSTRVVEPRETGVMAPREDSVLTLITCYPFRYVGRAPRRFVVVAHLVEQAQSAHPPGEAPDPSRHVPSAHTDRSADALYLAGARFL